MTSAKVLNLDTALVKRIFKKVGYYSPQSQSRAAIEEQSRVLIIAKRKGDKIKVRKVSLQEIQVGETVTKCTQMNREHMRLLSVHLTSQFDK